MDHYKDIEELTAEEVEVVLNLISSINPFFTKDKIHRDLTRLAKESPKLILILFNESAILGCALAEIVGTSGYIRDIVVDTPKRNQGYGSTLLKDLVSIIQSNPIVQTIHLDVHHIHAHAIPFYYRHGFRFQECHRDTFGPGEDTITMVLER